MYILVCRPPFLGTNASNQKNQSQAGGQPLGYVLENDHFI